MNDCESQERGDGAVVAQRLAPAPPHPYASRRSGSGREQVRMVSFAVVVPVSTMEEVERLRVGTGLAKTHFIATSLLMGARRMAKELQGGPDHA